MKEICFISQCSLPIPTVKGGAVETLVEYIINENEKCGKYHFTVLSIADEKAMELSKHYKYTKFIYIAPTKEKWNKIRLFIYRVLKHCGIYISFSGEFKKVYKELRQLKNKEDVFIFEAGPTTQIPAISRIVTKDKLVVHIHWDGMSNKRKDRCFSTLMPVSDYIGECWKKGCNCEQTKIKTLHNCTKIERFIKRSTNAEKTDLRIKLGIPENNKIVIFTGRVVEAKGIKELLQAFENISYNNATLLIIGSANFGSKTNTTYEKEVSTLIKQSNKSIVFTGFIHQTELYKYYNIADIAVMPSMFEDPAPLVCIETQATGTPLIANDVGGIKEYINKNGVVLLKKDKKMIENLTIEMDRLLSNPELCKKMGEANQQHALRYNTEQYFQDFSCIMDNL